MRDEILRRFTYQKPTPEKIPVHEQVNAAFLEFAHKLDALIPEGREKALALTELQASRMWANAAIATT